MKEWDLSQSSLRIFESREQVPPAESICIRAANEIRLRSVREKSRVLCVHAKNALSADFIRNRVVPRAFRLVPLGRVFIF